MKVGFFCPLAGLSRIGTRPRPGTDCHCHTGDDWIRPTERDRYSLASPSGHPLPIASLADFTPIQQAIRQYVFPHAAGVTLTEEYIRICHGLAGEMIEDLHRLAVGRPGILSELREWAKHLGMVSTPDFQTEYEILFPCDVVGDEWQERQKRQQAAAADLAERLGGDGCLRCGAAPCPVFCGGCSGRRELSGSDRLCMPMYCGEGVRS